MKYLVSAYCMVPMKAETVVDADTPEQAVQIAKTRWEQGPRHLIPPGTDDEKAPHASGSLRRNSKQIERYGKMKESSCVAVEALGTLLGAAVFSYLWQVLPPVHPASGRELKVLAAIALGIAYLTGAVRLARAIMLRKIEQRSSQSSEYNAGSTCISLMRWDRQRVAHCLPRIARKEAHSPQVFVSRRAQS